MMKGGLLVPLHFANLFRSARLASACKFNINSRFYSTQNYDIAIVGGGIIGLATGQELINRHSNLKFILLEKEHELAFHQTGHNSGVIHAGIYYKPGTLKAKLCVEGLELTYKYCDKYKIPYKRCGKLIVAVTDDEVPRLEELYKRGTRNGVKGLTFLSKSEMKEIEPYCEGKVALLSPNTGIVDWGLVAKTFGNVFQSKGGTVLNDFEVVNFVISDENEKSRHSSHDVQYPLKVIGKNKESINCRYVVTCGGLFSDRLATKSGCSSEPKIVPFRGEYLVLRPEKQYLVNGNIYPVPDPKLPFLGVHFTPRMDGSIWLGPNALLAFHREGYRWTDISAKDLFDSLKFSGLQKLILKHWKFGASEFYRSIALAGQVKQLQKYIPELQVEDVVRGPAGVRAQALDKDGNLVDDFVFDTGHGEIGTRVLHVRNAPSPAATSSLAIAHMIADRVARQFNL